MANYIVSYDLNGSRPTHQEMDKHMESAGWERERILETVWYVGTEQETEEVFDHVKAALSPNDQVIVILVVEAVWHNLLITDDSLHAAFENNG